MKKRYKDKKERYNRNEGKIIELDAMNIDINTLK